MSSWRARGPSNPDRGNTPWRGPSRGGGSGASRGRGRGQGANHVPPRASTNAWSSGRPSGATGPASQAARRPVQQDPKRRQMELMASVSRSSGLEKDGDSLKDYKTQEEYRSFIQEKLEVLLKRPALDKNASEAQKANLKDEQENLLILFRKLREGVASSNRTDSFALEIYETSLFLSAIFNIPRQTTAIISHLIPDLYLSYSGPHPNIEAAILVALLHHLIAAYPSQGVYNQHLDAISSSLFPRDCTSRKWIVSLAICLRTKNYCKVEHLTKGETVLSLLHPLERMGTEVTFPASLSSHAVRCLVDRLREKARQNAWAIIRSAYRELSCNDESADTRTWLTRSLYLDSVASDQSSTALDQWLDQHSELGHVRKKEGVEGRWVICKVR
ncbi:hypothetical protein AX16_008049 [Volvariella volvacea WC 439]|nr:hypothetical protein AX16_008049 [Volvariella volvacea WC 439]